MNARSTPASRAARYGVTDPSGADRQHDGVREVGGGQQVTQLRDLVGAPQVVVGLVADDLASRLGERGCPVDLAAPGSFRVVEEADPGIALSDLRDQLACLVGDAVSDHEDLDVFDCLLLHRPQRWAEELTVVVGREDDGGDGQCRSPWSRRLSSP